MNSSPPPPSFTLPPLTSAGRLPVTPDDSLEGYEGAKDHVVAKSKGKQRAEAIDDGDEVRISMYVRLFDEMINTVLESESYLFTPREIWVLKHILGLSYEPHYLLTRLLLRRPGKIHPFSSLVSAYSAELGDEGVKRAMRELSKALLIPAEIIAQEPTALTAEDKPPPPATPSENPYPAPLSLRSKGKRRASAQPWAHLPTGMSPTEEKADPQLAMVIRESLWAARVGRVEVDEDGEVIASPPLNRLSGSRSVSAASSSSSSSSRSPHVDFTEEFSLTPRPSASIAALARDEMSLSLDETMSCILAEELRRIARARKVPLNMLGNREAVMEALRGVAKKQAVLGFTPLKVKGKERQSTLPFFPDGKVTSESLLVAQLLPLIGGHALQLTPELHSLIARVNLIFSRTPPLTTSSSSLLLPSILVTSCKRRYPDYGPPTRSIIWKDRQELLTWERAVHWEAVVADALGDTWQEQRKNPMPGFGVKREMLGRVEGAKVVKRVWEGVWPLWLELVQGEAGEAVDTVNQEGGLVGDRFKTGHVLTRIVYKAATALGVLHEYDSECLVLRALLKQRRWRRSKRGAWYERLALVLMNHYNASPEEKEAKCREATQVCIDGLLDEDTHLIYRPALSRRLTRLENKLDLPADERHISYAELLKCETRELSAPRVKENMGQPKVQGRSESAREREGSLGLEEEAESGRGRVQQVGKSVWVGRDGEVTVEGWVLEWWEKKGFKGFHSEGTILTTLFGLLLWPVLFHALPGAFETPYQTAPLDLGEDTFAPARAELLEQRLQDMCKTKVALQMLRETDARERDRQTWAVGVSWEYGRDDLEEVLQCIGGTAISGICRMLAEEYRHRVSGVPDLIVWNHEKREARFVEVKGPGDSLSETQKVWIDVLLSAGVQVEVCKVKATEPSATAMIKLEKQSTKRKVSLQSMSSINSKSESLGTNGWGMVKEYQYFSGEDVDEEDGGEDVNEWRYESGEEGKAEGHWERAGKRSKRGVSVGLG